MSTTAIAQNQAWDFRAPIMKTLIQEAFTGPVSALEIGVWYGIGSTNIWLENLKPGSTLCLVDAWKPYSSVQDLADKEYNYKKMDDLSTDAYLSAFLNVKKFESENDKNINIQLTRGDSAKYLPMLRDGVFDFIYIDGDHKYDKVKSDIQQAKRLVNKRYGIICGDDLEKLPTPELVELSRVNKGRDYLRGGHEFHPGVLLAVAEEFTAVNMINGFWWVVCVNAEFDTEVRKPAASVATAAA
jgi:hypothetical protein